MENVAFCRLATLLYEARAGRPDRPTICRIQAIAWHNIFVSLLLMTNRTMLRTVRMVDDGGRMVWQDDLPLNLRDSQQRPKRDRKTLGWAQREHESTKQRDVRLNEDVVRIM